MATRRTKRIKAAARGGADRKTKRLGRKKKDPYAGLLDDDEDVSPRRRPTRRLNQRGGQRSTQRLPGAGRKKDDMMLYYVAGGGVAAVLLIIIIAAAAGGGGSSNNNNNNYVPRPPAQPQRRIMTPAEYWDFVNEILGQAKVRPSDINPNSVWQFSRRTVINYYKQKEAGRLRSLTGRVRQAGVRRGTTEAEMNEYLLETVRDGAQVATRLHDIANSTSVRDYESYWSQAEPAIDAQHRQIDDALRRLGEMRAGAPPAPSETPAEEEEP